MIDIRNATSGRAARLKLAALAAGILLLPCLTAPAAAQASSATTNAVNSAVQSAIQSARDQVWYRTRQRHARHCEWYWIRSKWALRCHPAL